MPPAFDKGKKRQPTIFHVTLPYFKRINMSYKTKLMSLNKMRTNNKKYNQTSNAQLNNIKE